MVLDLRNNGGGSLDEAIQLTGLFIEQGPVVQVRESGGRVTVNGDRDDKVTWDGPLAVLINRGSASASEIFAGAIQDYGRGLVIGETSFGKGTVQNIVDLDRWPANESRRFGQVKLTIAQFFRISGSSTQHKGVLPDIAFPASVGATEFGESTYENALPWTRIASLQHTQYGNFSPILSKLKKFISVALPMTLNSNGGKRMYIISVWKRKRSTSYSTKPNVLQNVENKKLNIENAKLFGKTLACS